MLHRVVMVVVGGHQGSAKLQLREQVPSGPVARQGGLGGGALAPQVGRLKAPAPWLGVEGAKLKPPRSQSQLCRKIGEFVKVL